MTKVEKLIAHKNQITTKTHAVGGGMWSIEVYATDGEEEEYIFELVGNNGTQDGEEADDLWADLAELQAEAEDWLVINKVNAPKEPVVRTGRR